MRLRVGIDLVAVASVREALATHGERYLSRIFTSREVAACSSADGPDPARLAAVFAAKEAAIKLLRPTADAALPWTDVGVRLGRDGGFTLELGGSAARRAAELQLTELSVSLTREPEHAAAVVLAGFRA